MKSPLEFLIEFQLNFISMKNALLTFLFLLLGLSCLQAQVIYEDFEGGVSDLSWNGINGTYNGAVANPVPGGVNVSEYVGSYTTNEDSDFNFAIADLPAPADMAAYGLVKVKIWSPVAPTQALLKFEGSGAPVEKYIQITQANEWVEYSVDMTGGASNPTGLTKCIISFNSFLPGIAETFYWDDIVGYEAQTCYETFETGNELGWQGLDGEFTAQAPNPDPNSVNSSDFCGRYVKSNQSAYSLLLAESATPFDLSALNQFSVDIYATAPTQVLFKMEGGGGPAIEVLKNIALANVWQTYTFDLSAAKDYTNLTKMILFFDPGVETSGDTYYFDNICAYPQGACAGSTPNPDMIDDFECNRNATYASGWDILQVVDNPFPNPINPSAKAGQYEDPPGEWENLLIDYKNAFDLSAKNQLKVKIWSPKATQVLFKLEGGASPAFEYWVTVDQAGQWAEYTADFSSQSAANHKRIVIFFNGGNQPEPGDIYYIDDIQWAEQTETVLEDFENGAILPWEPLDQQTVLHGTFAVVDNPAPGGVNTSGKVGKYTKGAAAFSTLTAVAPGFIDISQKPQYNLDVWAPAGAVNVTMQLESTSQGIKDVTRNLENPGNWETLHFDFTDFQNISDWVGVNLIFNPGIAEAGAMFFFDNLTQSSSTVDPCEGVVALANIIDDFECQRNYPPGAGASELSVVVNPAISVVNSSTQVGKYEDQPNEPWAALCYDFPAPIDLGVYNQLSIMVNAEQAAPILFKLEGGSSPAAELWADYTDAGEWQKISVDFSQQAGTDQKRVCFFFNGGNDHSGTVETYYIDNIALLHAPYDGCIMNFDSPAFTSTEWTFFPADNSGGFELVDNPDQSGINTSLKVGKAIEKASGQEPWQGMYADLASFIDLSVTKRVKMKVWSPQIATITMKLENPATAGAPASSGDNTIANTKANEWEDLTWDFSTSPTPLPDDGQYRRVTLIFDINNLPASDVVYYFDDIRLEGSECPLATSVFEPAHVETLSIAPNPVSNQLRIENLGEISVIEIYNLLGRRVAGIWVGNDATAQFDVSNLPAGTYTIAGFTRNGVLKGNARFVKL